MNCCRKGFTIIEVLTVVVIMGLVISGVAAIYLMGITAWKEGGVQIGLQREASIAMEKMVRGVYGTDGIRQAEQIAVSSTSILVNFVGAGGIRSFYFSPGLDNDADTPEDNQLRYIDESYIDKAIIESNVRTLTFEYLSNDTVEVDLIMERQVLDRTIKVGLVTKVGLRNYTEL